MKGLGWMRLGETEFEVECASFLPVTHGEIGPGWDFLVYGHCVHDADADRFRVGVALRANGSPVPLTPADDYLGVELALANGRYPESGETWFSLEVEGYFETWDVKMRFVRRSGHWYRLEFESVTTFWENGGYTRFTLSTWAEALPTRESPRNWGVWPRRRCQGRTRSRFRVRSHD